MSLAAAVRSQAYYVTTAPVPVTKTADYGWDVQGGPPPSGSGGPNQRKYILLSLVQK